MNRKQPMPRYYNFETETKIILLDDDDKCTYDPDVKCIELCDFLTDEEKNEKTVKRKSYYADHCRRAKALEPFKTLNLKSDWSNSKCKWQPPLVVYSGSGSAKDDRDMLKSVGFNVE